MSDNVTLRDQREVPEPTAVESETEVESEAEAASDVETMSVSEDEAAAGHLRAQKIVAAQRREVQPVFRQVTLLMEDEYGNVAVDVTGAETLSGVDTQVTNVLEDAQGLAANQSDSDSEPPDLSEAMARLGVRPQARNDDSSDASALTDEEFLSDREPDAAAPNPGHSNASKPKPVHRKRLQLPTIVTKLADESDSDCPEDVFNQTSELRFSFPTTTSKATPAESVEVSDNEQESARPASQVEAEAEAEATAMKN